SSTPSSTPTSRLSISAPIRSARSCSGRDSALRRISSREVAMAKAYSCAKRSGTCPLTVKLRGRPAEPDWRRRRTISSCACGAKQITPHGPLQRLLESRLRNKTDFDLDVQAVRELENLIKGLAVKLCTDRLQRHDFGESAWRLRGGLRRRSSANDRFSQQESSLISRRQGTHEPAMT